MSRASEIPPLQVVALPEPPVPGRNVGDVVAEIRQLRDAAVVFEHICGRALADFLGANGDGTPDLLVQFVGEVPHLVDRDAVNSTLKELLRRPATNRSRARALLRGVVAIGRNETDTNPEAPNQEAPLLPVTAQGHTPHMDKDGVVENTWQLQWPRERGDRGPRR